MSDSSITYIVYNEQAYLDLIADAVQYGIHRPNRWAEGNCAPDSEGMSVVDSFDRLAADEIYNMFGAYTTNVPPGTQIQCKDGWEEYQDQVTSWDEALKEALDRKNLKLDHNHESLLIPCEKDYPIMVLWNWYNDFNRMGSCNKRQALWYSLKKIRTSHKNGISHLQRRAKSWHRKYDEDLKTWIKLSEQRRADQRKKEQDEAT